MNVRILETDFSTSGEQEMDAGGGEERNLAVPFL
jgi:hypothetical protein